ncbi:MAG: cytidylate kinase family protein, partial [Bacteroides sp.]|nr:cytidylate kinase family protein [Bacteroides sp.]
MSKYMFRRYLLFIVSLFVNAFGIAFITRALLGTSPITSVTYVLSMFTPYTMGIWTILLNLLFVVLEMFLMTRQELKSDLRMFLLQIPIS